MKGKRSNVEFEKHEVIATVEGDTKTWYLKIPETRMNSIKFINSGGIMAVTGDYGNWIFCREFIPNGKEGGVSDQYWEEKLRIASTQNPYEFDEEETIKEINRIREEEEDLTQEENDYLDECISAAQEGGEVEYNSFAYQNGVGRFSDYESVPSAEKRTQFWLKAVFDGFDEICRRMKEGSK